MINEINGVTSVIAKEIQSKNLMKHPHTVGHLDNIHYDWQYHVMVAVEALTVIVVMALLMVLMVIVIRDVLKNLFYVV
jgi:hypothetical protein